MAELLESEKPVATVSPTLADAVYGDTKNASMLPLPALDKSDQVAVKTENDKGSSQLSELGTSAAVLAGSKLLLMSMSRRSWASRSLLGGLWKKSGISGSDETGLETPAPSSSVCSTVKKYCVDLPLDLLIHVPISPKVTLGSIWKEYFGRKPVALAPSDPFIRDGVWPEYVSPLATTPLNVEPASTVAPPRSAEIIQLSQPTPTEVLALPAPRIEMPSQPLETPTPPAEVVVPDTRVTVPGPPPPEVIALPPPAEAAIPAVPVPTEVTAAPSPEATVPAPAEATPVPPTEALLAPPVEATAPAPPPPEVTPTPLAEAPEIPSRGRLDDLRQHFQNGGHLDNPAGDAPKPPDPFNFKRFARGMRPAEGQENVEFIQLEAGGWSRRYTTEDGLTVDETVLPNGTRFFSRSDNYEETYQRRGRRWERIN